MKTKTLLAIFICTFANLHICTFAQDSLRALSSTTGAACYEVEYYNNFLFTGTGNTFSVYDVSTAIPYTKLFQYRFTSNIDDIRVKGNKLFIAANHAGLSMWDISNPASPTLLDEYVPDSLDESAYNIAFFGDTIFLAYKTKMAVFKNNGNSISLLKKFAYQPGNSLIRGCEVKGNILAFVSAYGTNPQTGVHLYDATTLTQLSFYQQDFCDPENVVFGKNTNLLHILGGTESYATLGFVPSGLFYSLDITNSASPAEIYRDTLEGIFYLAVAQPRKGENENDTIYVATNAALDMNYIFPDPPTGHIYIYDATNPSNVHLINTVNAGLWFFDLAMNNKKIYIASEWYGIKTIDISDIMNEVDLGNTLTGGWNLASAKYGNRLAVGNEGYGFKVYDITNVQNPVLQNAKVDSGFCMGIEFSKDGNYIYGFYYTLNDFKVFDANTLTEVASIPINASTVDWTRTQVWQDKAIAIEAEFGSPKKILVVDVSNPLSPTIDTQMVMNNVRDIWVNKNGKMFVATNDSLSIFDLNNFQLHLTISPPSNFFNDFVALAEYKDTLYAYISGFNGGIYKYYYNGSNQLTLITNVAHPITNYNPEFLAVDSFGLYLNYVEQGLYSFDKNSLTQKGYYRHGMEWVHTNQWGIEDVFCKDNLIFLVEYFGQTTILTNDNNFTPCSVSISQNVTINQDDTLQVGNDFYTASGTYVDTLLASNGCDSIVTTNLTVLTRISELQIADYKLQIVPNPFTNQTQISYSLATDAQIKIELYNMLGQKIKTIADEKQTVGERQYLLDFEKENSEIYFLKIKIDNTIIVKKIIHQK